MFPASGTKRGRNIMIFRKHGFAMAAVALTALGLSSGAAPAADGVSTPQGNNWDNIKQLPDWQGVWVSQSLPNAKGWPLNDKGQAQNAQLMKLRAVNGDVPSRSKKCEPGGFPGGMSGPEEYTEEWVFTPGEVLLTQTQGFVRRIYTDGRKHHPGPVSMQGDAIGHWEGSTLVTDTVGLDPGNEIFYGFPGGKNMHVVERIFLKDPNTMQIDTTLDAPDILTKPTNYTILYKRHRDWTPVEMDCAQNNRSVDANGNQTMKIAPDDNGNQIKLAP
jgi:hypothetical protein